MDTISTGEPNTLKTWRKIALALGGENSSVVKFFDEKIANSPHGEDEKVIAAEEQMLILISQML
jgi:hypothetical protein